MAQIFNVYVDSNNISFYNLYNTVIIDGNIDPTLYTEYYWTDSDNWYSTSYKFYKTTRLWWIILVVNNIQNPFDEISGGTKIKILNGPTVSQILNQMVLSN